MKASLGANPTSWCTGRKSTERKFLDAEDCELSDDSCWFIHEEITDNDGDTFVDMETEVSEQKEEGFFHKVQEKAPPDQLKLILERLDMLSVQVYQLKRSQNKK